MQPRHAKPHVCVQYVICCVCVYALQVKPSEVQSKIRNQVGLHAYTHAQLGGMAAMRARAARSHACLWHHDQGNLSIQSAISSSLPYTHIYW